MQRQLIAGLLCLAAIRGATAETPYFLGLGDFPGGTHASFASGVAADGSAVVGFGISGAGQEAFYWTAATGMTGLGQLPDGIASEAHGISADGSTVVGVAWRSGIFSYPRAFRWTAATGMVELPLLPNHPEFLPGAGANAVSADGSVIVGTGDVEVGDDIGVQAFRWTQETGTVALDIVFGIGTGVSADGSVVTGYGTPPGGLQAVRWTAAEGAVGLGFLPRGRDSRAWAISADGGTIVGQADSSFGLEAFRWTADEGMTGLGDLPGDGFSSIAYGVSDNSVVVGQSVDADGLRAFLWDELNGMRDLKNVLTGELGLNLTGWTLVEAQAITPDGRTIVGSGFNPLGQQEAWLAHIPEPAMLSLVAVGAVLLGLAHRRPLVDKAR